MYDSSYQIDNKDFGDLPKSKKQLTDLQQLPSAGNKLGDILGHNKELGENPILWQYEDIPFDLWVCILNKIISNHISF